MYLYLIALFCAIVFNATANLLLKFAAHRLEGLFHHGVVHAAKTALTCPTLILALLFFALNVPLYFLALRKLPVSVAYPVMVGAGFAIIAAVAAFSHLGERPSTLQWLGVATIMLGVVLVSSQIESKHDYTSTPNTDISSSNVSSERIFD